MLGGTGTYKILIGWKLRFILGKQAVILLVGFLLLAKRRTEQMTN